MLAEQRQRDTFPFLRERSAGRGPFRTPVPIAGVAVVAFLAMQVGMYPGARGVVFLLHDVVRLVPLVLRIMP